EPQEPEEKQFQKVYEDEAIKVTASYNEDAGIPEEAELVVQPAAEDAEADPAEAEAVQALLGEKEPSAKMSYTIGFFVDGQEIEPTGVVTITVQLPEGQQVAPGAPVTVIHYGENGPEAIQGSNVMEKDGKLSVSFDSSAFSKFMIVIGEPEEEPAGENPEGSGEENGDNGENPDGAEEEPKTETVSYKLQDSFLYENDDFRLTLRVTGTATAEMPVEAKTEEPNGDNEEGNGEEEAPGADGEVQEGTDTQKPDTNPEELDAQEPDATAADDAGVQGEAEASDKPDEGQAAGTGEAENSKKDEVQTQDNSQDGQNSGNEVDQPQEKEPEKLNVDDVKMDLQFLGQEDEAYREIEAFVQNESKDSKLLDLSVMHYSFTYKDVPLDISACEVRAEIALKEKAAQTALDEADADTKPENTEGDVAGTGGNAAEEPTAGDNIPAEDGTDGDSEVLSEGDVSAEEPTIGEGDSGEEPTAGESESAIDAMRKNDIAENEMLIVSLIQDNGTEYETADSKNLTEENNSSLVMKAENLRNATFAMSYASGKGPKFTVQYYARLDRIQYSESGKLDVIDTRGKRDGKGGCLPQNGIDPAVIKMVLTENGGIYTPATEKVLTKIFKVEEPYQFYISQNLENVDILYQSDNYTRKEIWVLKENGNPESEDMAGNDWLQFTDIENVKFVYNESAGSDPATNTIAIHEGTVLRLVYDPEKKDYNNAAKFYDYDISDGYIYKSAADATGGNNKQQTSAQTAGTWFAKTKDQGINSPSNYPQNTSGSKLAFGNKFAGTGLGEVVWQDKLGMTNKPNMSNVPTGYKGCTFGIVSGLEGGKIQYSDKIIAPNLFNDGDAVGKTAIDDWALNFDRVGDTYTLKSVWGAGDNANMLDQFNHPKSNKVHTDIYTNNFWPMDASKTFGSDGHDLKFGDLDLKFNRKYGSGGWDAFPNADDGCDHNSYFGMQYAINFSYTDTYCGPLEYLFFGDDDMWVFLDGKLICDIGGVHSSVGALVDLWDYLTPKDAGKHTLQVFYTERGASGSTCYMQFTLPSVSSAPLDTDTGLLYVEKRVEGVYEENTEYEFTLSIDPKNDSVYPYTVSRANGSVKTSGNIGKNQQVSFSLGKGENVVVNFLPLETTYTVTELSGSTYTTTVSVNGGTEQEKNEVSGTITNGRDEIVYTNHTAMELPKTGGFGVIQYTFGGIAVTAAGLMYGYQWKRRRERRNQN
ncbi:MAG: fibro-slime domain-containing protein, partial [Lachnospiraceae bacterium]|nr:fibro-slime domain-containing protein [Lachnospiraceae bacterium]